MKTITFLFAVLFAAGLNNSHAQNTWTKKADFGGAARASAVGFSIGNKGYVGTGDINSIPQNDFWEYDPSTNAWTQKANFGGASRTAATGFSIGSKAYIGSGGYYDAGWHYYKDFWEYDPSTNSWSQKANLITGSAFASGFSIGNKGYICTGSTGSNYPYVFHKDFWEYNPATDVWKQKSDFAGMARSNTAAFSIGSKGYIGTGGSPDKNDFWEYDPSTNAWTQKANFGGTARAAARGFSIGSKGYIGTGTDESILYKDFWEYDPSTNAWTQKADFGGTARDFVTVFSIGSKGYIGTGSDGSNKKDFWEYIPETQTPGTWKTTGGMKTARVFFTATLLKNGKVLVTGGYDGSNVLASAELYDPTTGTWTPTSSMTEARSSHSATLLPNGKVLVAGGGTSPFSSAELYDPNTGTWTPTGSMKEGRYEHMATILSNGLVLVAGGLDKNYVTLTSAELYDPNTGLWVKTGSMAVARYWEMPSPTILSGGPILVVGGTTCCPYQWINEAEIYDPVSQTWTATSNKTTHAKEGSILLPDGKVLVAGGPKGTQPNVVNVADAELFDPATGKWTGTESMSVARNGHTLSLLTNGQVLATGGHSGGWGVCNDLVSSELYDPNAGTWSFTGNMNFDRQWHTATVLPNGQVLIAGGQDCDGNVLSSVELYAPPICNGLTVYADADGDGYGNVKKSKINPTCDLPTGYVLDSTDCNDANASIHPLAREVCNGIDDNCNGLIDEISGLKTTNITATTATFNWKKLPGSKVYAIKYRRLEQPAKPWTVTGAAGSAIGVIISGLRPNSNYEWMIRSDCGGLNAAFYGPVKFKTAVALSASEEREESIKLTGTGLSVYPNPGDGNMTVSLSLSKPQAVLISVLDVTGKEVYASNESVGSGAYMRQLDLSKLNSGTYFLKLIHDGKSEIKKIVVRK